MSIFCFLFHYILFVCFSLSVRLSTANILGNETDRLALLAFKSQVTLDPQNALSSWNDSRHFCEWEGVACSHRRQRVRYLNLTSRGLVGSVSPHVGNLSFLRILDIENNSFNSEIPQQLGNLFRLEELILGNNSLVGEIPVNLSRCSRLVTLTAAFNYLVGKIPMELGSLSELVTLRLAVNKLTGVIPPSMGNLTSLDTLSIAENNFGGGIPNTLTNLKNLRKLALSSCKLTGMFPPSLFNHSIFEIISVTDNQLTGTIPAEIGGMLPNIQFFFIGKNRFSGVIPTSLFNATTLQMVDLSYNQFTGKVPLNIGNLKDLTVIYMRGNTLGDGKSGDLDFVTSVTNCTHLQIFDISTNQFGGSLPASIANFSNQLNLLYLYGNQISGRIPSGIENLHNLILLDISTNFFNGSIPKGFGNLQNLQVLSVKANRLSGQIPSILKNMSQLFSLDLSYNSLEGSIEPSLDNQILQMLDLSYNIFTGTIPEQKITLSSRLTKLDLAHNSLDGHIPFGVGTLKSLNHFDVSENKFLGEIPSTLGSCLSLEYLYFQGNFFGGPIPSSLSSLKGLQVLDLSRNNLSGEIPKELENLTVLQNLNLSFNDIEGPVPVEGIFQNASAFSISGNHKICGGIPKLGLQKCNIHKSKKHITSVVWKVILGVLIPSFVVVLFLVIYLTKKHKAQAQPSEEPHELLRRVSYNDLYKATNGFSSENLIGMGSYGFVYKGSFHQDGNPVAVKVLRLMEIGATKSFLAECEALRGVRHRNLLKILTVCSSVDFNGDDFKALVFEFMPNGNLESWLHPSSEGERLPRSLDLYQRLNIAIDIASALNYLHNDCDRPIVHCDLKSSNVLLDTNMTAHVGDFGLAKFLAKNPSNLSKTETDSIAVRGTIGYIPPEYGLGAEVSTRGDVYSYGILLLEMFTGKRPTDHMFKDGVNLHSLSEIAFPGQLMDIIDLSMLSDDDSHEKAINKINRVNECLTSIIRIGIVCSAELMTERMDIKDVLNEMHSIKEAYLDV